MTIRLLTPDSAVGRQAGLAGHYFAQLAVMSRADRQGGNAKRAGHDCRCAKLMHGAAGRPAGARSLVNDTNIDLLQFDSPDPDFSLFFALL